MIYMVLKYGMAIRDNALARITVPVNFGQEEDGSLEQSHGKTSRNPLRITNTQLKLHETFERIKAYSTDESPFLVWINSEGNLQVICRKDVVSKVFKTLYSNQKSIGLALVDVKTHVNLTPLSTEELVNAYGTDVLNALLCKGWWSLETGHLLERSIVTDVPTLGQSRCGSLKLNHVSILSKSNLLVMIDPKVFEFRHIVTQELLSKTIEEASEALSGSIVRVLPTLTYAIVCEVRHSTNEEAKDMFRCWNAIGIQLKFPESVEYAIDVRFEEDEDSSWLTFPACLVLSPSGFATQCTVFGDHLESDVCFLLSHLVRDLETAKFSLWSPKSLKQIELRSLESKSGQIADSSRSLWSSAVAPGSKQASKDLPGIGGIIDLTNYLDFDGTDIELRFRNLSSKKVTKATHRRAGPELHSLFSKLAQQEVVNVIHTNPRANESKISKNKMIIARNNEKRSSVKINLAKKGIKGKGSVEKVNGASKPKIPLEKSSKRQTCKSNMPVNTGNSKDLYTHLEIKHLFDQGMLEKHKMPVLKTFCKSLGLSNKGKKQEIVQRIKEHLESMPDIRLES